MYCRVFCCQSQAGEGKHLSDSGWTNKMKKETVTNIKTLNRNSACRQSWDLIAGCRLKMQDGWKLKRPAGAPLSARSCSAAAPSRTHPGFVPLDPSPHGIPPSYRPGYQIMIWTPGGMSTASKTMKLTFFGVSLLHGVPIEKHSSSQFFSMRGKLCEESRRQAWPRSPTPPAGCWFTRLSVRMLFILCFLPAQGPRKVHQKLIPCAWAQKFLSGLESVSKFACCHWTQPDFFSSVSMLWCTMKSEPWEDISANLARFRHESSSKDCPCKTISDQVTFGSKRRKLSNYLWGLFQGSAGVLEIWGQNPSGFNCITKFKHDSASSGWDTQTPGKKLNKEKESNQDNQTYWGQQI